MACWGGRGLVVLTGSLALASSVYVRADSASADDLMGQRCDRVDASLRRGDEPAALRDRPAVAPLGTGSLSAGVEVRAALLDAGLALNAGEFEAVLARTQRVLHLTNSDGPERRWATLLEVRTRLLQAPAGGAAANCAVEGDLLEAERLLCFELASARGDTQTAGSMLARWRAAGVSSEWEPVFWLSTGELASGQGDWGAAEAAFERARSHLEVHEDPTRVWRAYAGLARSLARSGRSEIAARHAEAAWSLGRSWAAQMVDLHAFSLRMQQLRELALLRIELALPAGGSTRDVSSARDPFALAQEARAWTLRVMADRARSEGLLSHAHQRLLAHARAELVRVEVMKWQKISDDSIARGLQPRTLGESWEHRWWSASGRRDDGALPVVEHGAPESGGPPPTREGMVAELERRRAAALREVERHVWADGRLPSAPVQMVSPNQIQAQLGEDEVFLSWLLGEDQGYLWIISPREVSVLPLTDVARGRQAARQLHTLLAGHLPHPADVARCSKRVAEVFLSPGWDRLRTARRWWVQPDGELWDIPLEVLPVQGGEVASAQSWITTHHDLAYVVDPALWLRRDGAPVRLTLPALLVNAGAPLGGCGAPGLSERQPPGSTLQPLCAVAGEISEIEAALRPVSRYTLLEGESTREEIVLEAMRQPLELVHLAAHGSAGLVWPSQTGLVLSRPPDDVLLHDDPWRRDGQLRLSDVLGARASPRLVVFSSCESASGPTGVRASPESLAAAALYMGAKTVIGSGWRVNDLATAELFKAFYREVGGTPAAGAEPTLDPITALNQVRRRLLASNCTRGAPCVASPTEWVAFRVYVGG